MVGEPDAALLGERLGIFVGEERPPHAHVTAAAEWPFAVDAGEHVVEHRVEEHRLEIFRRGASFVGLARFLGLVDRQVESNPGAGYWQHRAHHITSMSAWIAPAALIACRIAI